MYVVYLVYKGNEWQVVILWGGYDCFLAGLCSGKLPLDIARLASVSILYAKLS